MKNTFILDFETTGLNPYHDEIIEIAIKPYGKNEIYTKLTKPLKVKSLHKKIVEITKITDELLTYLINASTNDTYFNNINNQFINLEKSIRELSDLVKKTYGYNISDKLLVKQNELNSLSDNVSDVKLEDINFIGFEINEEYVKLCNERLNSID